MGNPHVVARLYRWNGLFNLSTWVVLFLNMTQRMLNLSPLPVTKWDNYCSQCLHSQWLWGCCEHLIRQCFRYFGTPWWYGLNDHLKFHWGSLVHDPHTLSCHMCEYCSLMALTDSSGSSNKNQDSDHAFFPPETSYSPGTRMHEQMLSSLARFSVVFFGALCHFSSKCPLQRIK